MAIGFSNLKCKDTKKIIQNAVFEKKCEKISNQQIVTSTITKKIISLQIIYKITM